MKHYIFLTLILLILPHVSTAQISSGGAFSMEKSVIATGGGESSGGAFNATGTTGQNAVGTITASALFNQIGGFWTYDQIFPTAATVSIGGNVKTQNGNGIRNVTVTLLDAYGASRTAITGSFGSYIFTDVEVGQTYVLKVSAKKYSFINSSQVISVNEELTELNFTGQLY